MSEEKKKLEFIDLIIIFIKWKKPLIILLLLTMFFSYMIIYFFVEEKYDARALIIPSETESIGGIGNLLEGLKGLPVDIGGGGNAEINKYNTLIFSRTSLEKIISKFDLYNNYGISKELIDYKELALKELKSNIETKDADEYGFEIIVRANAPDLAAKIANYIVSLLNESVVNLQVKKSKLNREFLEKRLNEIKDDLAKSEDSLNNFQQSSGFISIEGQLSELLKVYSDLESKLITKQVELSILQKIVAADSPQLKILMLELKKYESKLNEMKIKGQPNSIILAYNSLPEKALEFLRYKRNVEINAAIFEFILPLYEQAKFEEQKDIPILQVIDYAVPIEKKSYPPRAIFSLLITFSVFVLFTFIILFKENENWQNSEKILYIRKNVFKWNIN